MRTALGRASLAAVAAVVTISLVGACSDGSKSHKAAPSTPAPTNPDADTPYAHMARVPALTVTSQDFTDGQPMGKPQRSGLFGGGGNDTSPQVSWSGAPPATKSYAVTMLDQDAPTGSGFWHWAVANIPADVTSLPTGAGADNSTMLPPGAFQLPNDARLARYVGAAPPAGTGIHRYFLTVVALDVADIKVDKTATPALLGAMMASHTVARGHIMATAAP
jgi:Raf kinase inhibitor-like YbhB/YbcL family protein